MESTICLSTEWILKAGGPFKADSVFLIEKGACEVVGDIVLHLEREFGHVPKSVARRVGADSGNKSSTQYLNWHIWVII